MTTAQYLIKVRQDGLLELPSEADELALKPGEEIEVHITRRKSSPSVNTRNEGLLEALRQVAEITKEMPISDSSQTLQLIREGRSGAMYGSPSTD